MSFRVIFFGLILTTSVFPIRANTMLTTGQIIVDGYEFDSFAKASTQLKNGSRVYIGPGIYTEGFKIDKDDVRVVGHDTHFAGAMLNGKASFVVTGNNVVIESIECSGAESIDNNGACVRQEGQNLRLVNVHFRDSQQGILSHANTGWLHISFSRFENLGFGGRAHSIYAQNDELKVSDSKIVNTKGQGNSVKSRAARTILERVEIVSPSRDNSRLIDVPNGGTLIVSDSVLHQGKNSVNGQMIGIGHEHLARNRINLVSLTRNILISDRSQGVTLDIANRLAGAVEIETSDNVMIGRLDNQYNINGKSFESRKQARLRPGIPNIGSLQGLLILESIK